ncbi:MAG: hypothetical protein JW892_13595 [Anaerolineae bacterium]|nr:hypothetical protein [Anaerolineae bacterium]
MRFKILQRILSLVVLGGMFLTPLGALARLVGNEFSVVRYDFHEAWAGNVGSDWFTDKYIIAWAEQSQLGYYAEPYVGWLESGATTIATYRVAASTTHSSSIPDISCDDPDYCLTTWISAEQVFARLVHSNGSMGPIWRVDTGQPALRSVVTRGLQYYLVVWEMDDGRIAMRHVDKNNGPLNNIVYVQLPAGCTQGRNVQVATRYGSDIYSIAYECFDMVHLEARSIIDLSYRWWRTPVMPDTYESSPSVIAYSDGIDEKVVLAFDTLSPDLGIFMQVYDQNGNARGVPVSIAPPGSDYPRLADNEERDETVVVYVQGDNIHVHRIGYDGLPVGVSYAITTAPGEQYAPRISPGVGGQHLVVWTDLRAGATEGDIYAQWLELEPVLGKGGPLSNELPDNGASSYYQAPAQINQWMAMGIRPGPVGDLDLHLADSPDYNNVLASSIYGTGLADIVVMDGYQSGPAAYFPYVSHFAGDTYYAIEYAPSASRITEQRPTIPQENLVAESVARMFDIYALPGQLLDIQVAPDVPDLALALFDPRNGPQQALNQALIVADSGGGGQVEVLQYLPDNEGWYGLLVWKKDDAVGAFDLSANGAGTPPGTTVFLPLVARNY